MLMQSIAASMILKPDSWSCACQGPGTSTAWQMMLAMPSTGSWFPIPLGMAVLQVSLVVLQSLRLLEPEHPEEVAKLVEFLIQPENYC